MDAIQRVDKLSTSIIYGGYSEGIDIRMRHVPLVCLKFIKMHFLDRFM